MNDVLDELKNLNNRLTDLLTNAEPGISSWRSAVSRTVGNIVDLTGWTPKNEKITMYAVKTKADNQIWVAYPRDVQSEVYACGMEHFGQPRRTEIWEMECNLIRQIHWQT